MSKVFTWALYIQERFNPKQTVPLALFFGVAITFSTCHFLNIECTYQIVFQVSVALFLFFLQLRLIDDVKDFAHDCIHHPLRPLARGLVSVRGLLFSALLVLVIEFYIAIRGGHEALILFCVVTLYACLLFLEARVSDRMRNFFALYIAVHELMLLPLLVYLYLLAGASLDDMVTPQFILASVLFFALLFSIEVVRKVRAPENESGGDDTYSGRYGVPGSLLLLLSSFLIALVSFILVIVGYSSGSLFFQLFVLLCASVGLVFIVQQTISFHRVQDNTAEKKLFLYSVLYIAFLLVCMTSIYFA